MKIFFKDSFISIIVILLPILSLRLMREIQLLPLSLYIAIPIIIFIFIIGIGLAFYLIPTYLFTDNGYITFFCIGAVVLSSFTFYVISQQGNI